MPVVISKSLSTAEQVQMIKLLKNRNEISTNESIVKKLFHGPNEIKINEPPSYLRLLLPKV